MDNTPALYIFGGLPASGKSTLAKHLAKTIKAVYIRIDSIEEAILTAGTGKLNGPEGYEAAYTLAGENLENGLSVVADSVNPIEITRSAWRKVAEDQGGEYKEIEVVCSDKTEHQTRLKTRSALATSVRTLTWEDIENRHYEPWNTASVFDTAGETPEESKTRLEKLFLTNK